MRHLVALMIALLVPAAAVAKAGCAEDREKFCKEVIEAKGKVGACLNEHKAELSEACKAKLEAKAKDKEAKAKEKNAQDSAKMGEGEGTHTAPRLLAGRAIPVRSISPSREMSRATMRQNHEVRIAHDSSRNRLTFDSAVVRQTMVCRHPDCFGLQLLDCYLSLIPSQLLFKSSPGLSEGGSAGSLHSRNQNDGRESRHQEKHEPI